MCTIFKAVYRQNFCKCVILMKHVLYYSTTSNWSVCKSVYTHNPNQHHTKYELYVSYMPVLPYNFTHYLLLLTK